MSKKTNTNEVLESSVITNDVVTEVVTQPTYQELLTKFKTKSGIIRGLHSEGMDTKGIYKILKDLGVTNNKGDQPIRYQHVRNVLVTPIKKVG